MVESVTQILLQGNLRLQAQILAKRPDRGYWRLSTTISKNSVFTMYRKILESIKSGVQSGV